MNEGDGPEDDSGSSTATDGDIDEDSDDASEKVCFGVAPG